MLRARGTIRTAGFSIIELMISVALFLILSAAIMSSMMKTQQTRRTNEIRANLEDRVRAASEMIIHDVGQAGKNLAPDGTVFTATTFSNATSTATYTDPSASTYTGGGGTACGSTGSSYPLATVTASSAQIANLYLGASVMLWDATSQTQDQGWICGASWPPSGPPYTFSVMRSSAPPTPNVTHTAPVYGYSAGVFAEGILSQRRASIMGGSALQSSASQLYLMGDIDENGSLILVRYQCPSSGSGSLTRTTWNFNATSSTGNTVTLLDNVVCSFLYSDDPSIANVVPILAGPSDHDIYYYVVTAVNLYITATSDSNDPVTGQPFSVTKSYENIQPRNLINATLNGKTYLQWTPTSGVFAYTTLP